MSLAIGEMWPQIRAIIWVQFRMMRNRLPRTTVGTVVSWFLSILWYGLAAAGAVGLAIGVPYIKFDQLLSLLPVSLLGVMLFWQIFPVITLSGGWSLDLSKLQVYPIRTASLFTIEVLLRLTTSPEMVILLLGAAIGLARHPKVPFGASLFLLLYIPLNLFLSLAIRESLMGLLKQKKRFRELLTVFVLLISILPQLLTRTSLGARIAPYFMLAAKGPGTPWYEIAMLSVGVYKISGAAIIAVWVILAYVFAQRQFARVLLTDQGSAEAFGPASSAARPARPSPLEGLYQLPGRFFRDPFAALVERELRSLVRTPRFRVILGMACFFSVLIFLPMSGGKWGGGFMSQNYLPFTNTYGLMLIGEVLLWNTFGFDRKAAQIYFVTPVRFRTVLLAKNTVAVFFIVMQTAVVTVVASLFRGGFNVFNIASSAAITSVVGLFFLAFGNLTSVLSPRAVNPDQTFRRQGAGRATLWLFVCYFGMAVPIGLAFLARWAFSSDAAYFGVLVFDIALAATVYWIATMSAVHRAENDCERMIDALSKGGVVVGADA